MVAVAELSSAVSVSSGRPVVRNDAEGLYGWDSDYAYRVANKCLWWLSPRSEAGEEIMQEIVCCAWQRYRTVANGHRAPRKRLVAYCVRRATQDAYRYSPGVTRFGGTRERGYVDALDRKRDRAGADLESALRRQAVTIMTQDTIADMLRGCRWEWLKVAESLAAGKSWRAICDEMGICSKKLATIIERIRETLRLRGFGESAGSEASD